MIEWTEQALQQLDQANDYIALAKNPDVARRVVDHILASIQQLATFPISRRPGRVEGTRELVITRTPFVAAYAIRKDRIVVLALYHGAQRRPKSF